ncbi:MAG TPA: energy-coupling factor transporter ATPase [Eubacterium sp.]|nr:energy-coupling factor transporter ATPase [Eubacterium sp.]
MAKIEFKNVNYIYNQKTSKETRALCDVNLKIDDGEFLAIIGHTGSGKSTLIQLMDGLLKGATGEILVDGKNIEDKDFNKRELRKKVGLVFQNPENQLFEETVLKDVCFGPKNMGLSNEEAEKKAIEALKLVEVPKESYDKSVFELSGGQKRRVAIAGVLAMDPEVLILDEPTSGLDPQGRNMIMEQVKKLHEEKGISIVWVSHNMEQVALHAKRIVVMNDGKVAMDDTTRNIFARGDELEQMGLKVPQVTSVMHELKSAGLDVDTSVLSVEEAKDNLLKVLK